MCGVRFCRFNSLFTGDFFAALLSSTGALSRCASIVHGQVLQKRGGKKTRFIEIMPVFEGSLLIGQAGAR